MTYISWFSGLYLEDYFMYKAVTLAGGIREPLLTCSSALCLFGSTDVAVVAVAEATGVFLPPREPALRLHDWPLAGYG